MKHINEDIFGYQDTFEVVANEVQELATNAIEAHKNGHNEEMKIYYKAMYWIQAAVDAANFDKIPHAIQAYGTLATRKMGNLIRPLEARVKHESFKKRWGTSNFNQQKPQSKDNKHTMSYNCEGERGSLCLRLMVQ